MDEMDCGTKRNIIYICTKERKSLLTFKLL